MVEGNYRLNLLLKNETSKEFTSVENDITIPQSSSLQMGNLILAYRIEKGLSAEEKKAFKVENFQLYPSPRNDFTPGDNLLLFFQIYGLNEEIKEKGTLHIVIYKGEKKLRSQQKKIREYESLDYFLEEFSLAGFPPAYYKVRVSLFDKDEKEVLFEEKQFFVSPLATLTRPWINSAILPPSDDPLYLNILGNQLSYMKKFEKAKSLLEKAYRRSPTQIQFALSYSDVLFILKEYKSIVEILTPFLMKENYEVLELLARSCHALGELKQAISYYKDHISHHGISYSTFTLIGNCYYQLGNKEEALKAWEKSLKINPNQEKIKELVDSIKQEKNKC